VWGCGVDAGTDAGLKTVVTRAGLKWEDAVNFIGAADVEESWRAITAANRKYLYDRGMWGVPCVEFNDIFIWGQDKLWLLEEEIKINQFSRKDD